jgi:hypothetical protein
MSGWGTALAALGTGLSLYNASQANDRAEDSLAMQQAGIDEQTRLNARLESIYDEGSASLGNTLFNTLNAYGDFGAITPDRFNDFYDFVATNRADEEIGNASRVDDFYDSMMSTVGGMDKADFDAIYQMDEYAKENAPGTLDYSPLADSLAVKFAALRSQNTDREIAQTYGKALANIPPGMENSTLRVQMERSLADLAAQRRNEDLLASIDDAFNYIGSLQTASTNQQNMDIAERKMQQSLLGDAFGRRNQNMDYYLTSKGAGIDYNNAMDGMRNNTAVTDYNTALGLTSGENTLRNAGITQNTALATAPYDYAATGVSSVSGNVSNANTGIANLASTYGNIASGASKAFGYSLDSLVKKLG